MPSKVTDPTLVRWSLTAAMVLGVTSPSKRIKVGKLNESLPEKV
ncbi:unannotated protein [freshwater metagenome]|uniref:Unannotated protein n=1 Tax=freshwater metagenome TaxID=449393 RepID=A0A6J7UFW9_9ZZZZ